MGKYIYEYRNFEFELIINDYWHTIYKGQPRAKLYHNYCVFLDKLRSKVSKDKYVLDIGQNHSIFSVPAALMGYKVIGFEPVKANFEGSLQNMTNNGCKNWELFNLALSNVNAELDLYVPQCPDNASFSKEAAVANMKNKEVVEVERVKTVRFDDWILEHPEFSDIGFIKCDAQGSEHSIIQGASEFLKQAHDIYMIIEFENHLEKFGHSFEQLHELILSLGFEYKGDITNGDRYYFKK